ncbi:MAG: glycogen/starch synthase [Candidatus Margulisiibacteriota bacterium]
MALSRLNLYQPLVGQRNLRVVHVATQAYPYVPEQMRKGLSQVAGKVPPALRSLGVDASSVLPLFRTTREIIESEGRQLWEFATLHFSFGSKRRDVPIKTMSPPEELAEPTYFIDSPDFFDQEKMYGWANDIERFAFFCHAAMELQRHLDTAPDIFVCHDWHTALIPVYLAQLRADEKPNFQASDRFFDNTRSVLAVHDFAYIGLAAPPAFHYVGLGWERSLPGFAEFYDELSLLKAGLYRADRAYARSLSHIEAVTNGKYGDPRFAGVAKERLESGQLVGLFKNDELWGPDRELTDDLAQVWARQALSVYRSVAERHFPGMELAEQTSPHTNYLVLTTPEKLEQVSRVTQELYGELNHKDKALIDQAIAAGEESRFARIETADELRDLLAFIRVEPAHDFEQQMRNEGLASFLDYFFPGDINRLLSITLNLARCKELLGAVPDLDPTTESKVTIYQAMSLFPAVEERVLLDHVLGLFHTLRFIAEAAHSPDVMLARELAERGEFRDEDNLAHSTSDFRHFSEVYHGIIREENRSLFRAFLIGVLLHDIGKLVKHNTHASLGAQIFGQIRSLRGSVAGDELDFVKNIIRFHSLFGDAFIIREEDPEILHQIFELYPDRKLRDFAIRCLYLLGIADMNSVGHRGKLSVRDLNSIRQAYQSVLYARSHEELSSKLEKIGFGQESEGINRWNRWVVRETPSKPSAEDEAIRQKDASLAAQELDNYCRQQVLAENPELRNQLARTRSPKKKRKLEAYLSRKISNKVNDLKTRLGAISDIRKIDSLTRGMDDARLRARLLIWLSEYVQKTSIKRVSFEFRSTQDRAQLLALLEKFDLAKINQLLDFEYDLDQDLLEISIPIDESSNL